MVDNYFDGYEEEDPAEEAHEKRITRCKSCNAKIIFLKTTAGHIMPIDADTVAATDTVFMYEKHTSHFASCPNHAKHRRSK